jgi:hypothetical protein
MVLEFDSGICFPERVIQREFYWSIDVCHFSLVLVPHEFY